MDSLLQVGYTQFMATPFQSPQLIRAEDLAASDMPEKFVELIDGKLIYMTPARKRHGRVASNIELMFRTLCASHPELDFGGSNDGFVVGRNPDTVLSPDASLYRARPDADTTWLEFAPEIVVEVMSPSNTRPAILSKRDRYFGAGTEQFWLVNVERCEVEIFHRDGRIVTAAEGARIAGEGVAAGMTIDLIEVFRER